MIQRLLNCARCAVQGKRFVPLWFSQYLQVCAECRDCFWIKYQLSHAKPKYEISRKFWREIERNVATWLIHSPKCGFRTKRGEWVELPSFSEAFLIKPLPVECHFVVYHCLSECIQYSCHVTKHHPGERKCLDFNHMLHIASRMTKCSPWPWWKVLVFKCQINCYHSRLEVSLGHMDAGNRSVFYYKANLILLTSVMVHCHPCWLTRIVIHCKISYVTILKVLALAQYKVVSSNTIYSFTNYCYICFWTVITSVIHRSPRQNLSSKHEKWNLNGIWKFHKSVWEGLRIYFNLSS